MSSDDPIQVVLQFEKLINSRNGQAIAAFMTADGTFLDSLGNGIRGTEKLCAAWTGYFKMVPDYSSSHSEIFADGSIVAVFGSAQGTFAKKSEAGSRAGWSPATESKENFWKTPAAWRAVVKDGKIALWQVYADNEPIRAIMRKTS